MSTHKAIVAKIDKVEEIPGAESIQIGYVLGERVVIGKDTPVDTVGVFFMPGLQLSDNFTTQNNLYRHAELNSDISKKGFFDDNRRVRAQTFMKVKSEGFFASLEMFEYLGGEIHTLPLGAQFDELSGKEICKRFYIKPVREKTAGMSIKKAKVNYAPTFHEHVETEQFKYYAGRIPKGATLFFHSKVHGTSARHSHTRVAVQLPKWKHFVNKIVRVFPTFTWEKVVGTRRVVLKPQETDKVGFHGSEGFRYDVHNLVAPYLEKGFTVYGEIAGFANGASIMPKHSIEALKDKAYTKKYGKEVTYTYGCKQTEMRFHIYRVTVTNEDGVEVDLSDAQCRAWCEKRGLLYALEVHPPIRYEGDIDALLALVEQLTERPEVLTEDYIDPTHISEGIILRIEDGGLIPTFLKSKSFAFRVCEGIATVVDMEEEQSGDVEEAV